MSIKNILNKIKNLIAEYLVLFLLFIISISIFVTGGLSQNNIITVVSLCFITWFDQKYRRNLKKAKQKLNPISQAIIECTAHPDSITLVGNSDSFALQKLLRIKESFDKGQPVDTDIENLIEPEELIKEPDYDPFPLIRTSSAQLIGMGILGTFIGLSFGIQGLDISNSENILQGTQSLLSGAGTAFLTSVFGMLASLLFTHSSSAFYTELNKAYYEIIDLVSNNHWTGFWDRKTEEAISYSQVLSRLIDQSEDIGKKIDGMAEDVSERISASISNTLKDYQQDLINTFQGGMGQAVSDGAQKAQQTYSILIQSMTDAAKQIQLSIGDLTLGLQKNIDNLGVLTEKIENTVSIFDDQVNSMGGTLAKLGMVDDSFSKINESFILTGKQFNDTAKQFEAAASNTTNSNSAFLNTWNNTNSEIQTVTERFKEIEQAFALASDNLIAVYKNTATEMNSFHQAVSHTTVNQMQEFRNAINDFSGRLASAANELQNVLENNPLNNSAQELHNATNKLSGVVVDYSKLISRIKSNPAIIKGIPDETDNIVETQIIQESHE